VTDGPASRHLLGGQTMGGHGCWNSADRSKAPERIRHRSCPTMGRWPCHADAHAWLGQWRGFRPGACGSPVALSRAAKKARSAGGKRFGTASAGSGASATGGATAAERPAAGQAGACEIARTFIADAEFADRRRARKISAAMAGAAIEHDPEKACPARDAGWVPDFPRDKRENAFARRS